MKDTSQTESQTMRILNWMLKGNKITQLTAISKFQCFRLSGRIFDINRMKKYTVKSEKVKLKSGKYVAEYSIEI